MPFWRRENKEEKEFERSLVASHVAGRNQARAMKMSDQQQLNSLGRAYYLQQDENVMNIIMEYAPYLAPAFSRLNATSQIQDKRDRRRLELQYEILLLKLKMEIPDEDVENRSFIDALEIYAKYRILDAMEGYRGKLVTEEIERTTVQVEQPKKKGFL